VKQSKGKGMMDKKMQKKMGKKGKTMPEMPKLEKAMKNRCM